MKTALPATPMYILGPDNTPIKVTDMAEWSDWCVKNGIPELIDHISKDVKVSTVFLCLDYNMLQRGPPLLWETIIFGGPHDKYQDRYSTYDEALAGHQKAVALAKGEFEYCSLIAPS